jgi:hypothetical protein
LWIYISFLLVSFLLENNFCTIALRRSISLPLINTSSSEKHSQLCNYICLIIIINVRLK